MQASREGFVQLLYAIILLQFGIIAVLLGGFSSEYLSNIYFRMWINTTYPWLGLLLGGQLDALLVGVATAGTFLLIQTFRAEIRHGKDSSRSYVADKSQRHSVDAAKGTDETDQGLVDSPNEVLVELERQDAL